MNIEHIKKIANVLLQKEYITCILSAVITTLLSVYFPRTKYDKAFERERLEKLIFPIYVILEKYLYNYEYKDISCQLAISQANDILNKNRLIAGNDLYNSFVFFKNTTNRKYKKKRFNSFSSKLISDYNKSCKRIGLPELTFIYRFTHKLFTPFQALVYSTLNILKRMLIVIGISALYILMYILLSYIT